MSTLITNLQSPEQVDNWQQEELKSKWIKVRKSKSNPRQITIVFQRSIQEEETQTAYMRMCYATSNE